MKTDSTRESPEEQNLKTQQDASPKAADQKNYPEKISGAQGKRRAVEELYKNIKLTPGVHDSEHLFISLMKTFSS